MICPTTSNGNNSTNNKNNNNNKRLTTTTTTTVFMYSFYLFLKKIYFLSLWYLEWHLLTPADLPYPLI